MARRRDNVPYSIYKRGKIYHAYFSFRLFNGEKVQIRESTGQTTEHEAEQYCIYRLNELKRRAERREAGELEEMTINEACSQFWEENGQFQRSNAIDERLRTLVDFFHENTLLSQIDEPAVNRFVQIKRRKLKPATVNRYLQDLSSVLHKARDVWKVKTNVVSVYKFLLKTPKENVKFFEPEEIDELIKRAPEHLKKIILVALYTGLRKSNVLSLRWEQVDFKNNLISVKVKDCTTEDGRAFTIPIIPKLKEVLDEIPRSKDGFVFHYNGKPIKDIKKSWTSLFEAKFDKDGKCVQNEIAYRNFHTLRHTCGTWIYRKTKDLRVVQKVLGHSDIKTTLKYAHVVMDEERRALEETF